MDFVGTILVVRRVLNSSISADILMSCSPISIVDTERILGIMKNNRLTWLNNNAFVGFTYRKMKTAFD